MNKIHLSVIVGIILLLASCKNDGGIFDKSGSTAAHVANLERENQQLREELAEIESRHENEVTAIRSDYEDRLAALQQQIEAGEVEEYDAYYVIVGSFKTDAYAREFSQKMKEMGFEGNIIPGPNEFNLVTYGTYQTLKSSLEPMRQARNTVSTEAWVYFER